MIKVLFFGRVRESLDCAEQAVPFTSGLDLDALQQALIEKGGPSWGDVLTEENMIRAINHEVVDGNPELAEGDEVAFFPPVTGG
ncbi:hypothetical protein A3709_09535 [Halioglobus sp. HI00S01]|uniref:MoaD/ThiS family protein n=1 Tax=Halioglobus sp. HI00S01 TaxID=1822214 RepID=UPI0007C2EA32|nr:MoaD/ThiS family protein [Halioglobus sp. HI00S01]KZX53363.1 hypothetical protein A3709_09535 [Halioglobus sp. HI00S01]